MQCDMCGSETNLVRAMIEGSEMIVCRDCSKFGKVLGPVRAAVEESKEKSQIVEEPERDVINILVSDFGARIRKKREELGMKQEDFARKISEKESLVHKIETREFEPSIDTARKLEKILGIKLVEEYEEVHEKKKFDADEEVTIGDLIKIKKR